MSLLINVEHFRETPGLCGPASLKIALSHFGKNSSEAELATLANSTPEVGTEHEGMIIAAQKMGMHVCVKERGSVEELESIIAKEKLPIIVGWFDVDGDHYSVVINITNDTIVLCDPGVDASERTISRELFPKIWFDFNGADNSTVTWGWYMIISLEPITLNATHDLYTREYDPIV